MATRNDLKQKPIKDIDISKEARVIRIRRLSKTLTDLIDLKVRGIITEQEFKRSKKRILGF